jgi:hypothetical protein
VIAIGVVHAGTLNIEYIEYVFYGAELEMEQFPWQLWCTLMAAS